MTFIHIPVLLRETLEFLDAGQGGKFLDGTVGLGGHAAEILNSSSKNELCGLDRDRKALEMAKLKLALFRNRVALFHLPYASFPEAMKELGWTRLNGVLLDLGISSMQLDNPERGFSFRNTGPLDMRMNQQEGQSAVDFVNQADFEELRECIARYGEDPLAERIARSIVRGRSEGAVTDTGRLADLIRRAYPPAWRAKARNDPATRAFQAIRMKVNDEPGQLKLFLEQILNWLAPHGRLVIISFHSLEDRIVKRTFREWAKEAGDKCPAVRILQKKPVCATVEEQKKNPRASSAKLRAVERLAENCHDHS